MYINIIESLLTFLWILPCARIKVIQDWFIRQYYYFCIPIIGLYPEPYEGFQQ